MVISPKSTQKNSQNLLKIFEEYEAALGQLVNLEKSTITFGNWVYRRTREGIMHVLNIPKMGGRWKDLGLPEQLG